jgi:prolyl oligopeptidase
MTEINNQPVAPIQPVTDNYFGTEVVDNYRYMENFQDPAVQEWVRATADYTIDTLSQLPGRKALFVRMMELDASVPAKIFGIIRLANGKIFYRKQGARDDGFKLWMRNGIDGEEILLLDPDKFKPDTGKSQAIRWFTPSWDGKYVTYMLSASGANEFSLYVLDTETCKEVDKPISRMHYGGMWLPDNKSFLYTRLQEMKDGMAMTEKYQRSKVYLHVLGTDVENDRIVLGSEVTPLINISPVAIPFIVTVPQSEYIFAIVMYGTQKESDLYVSTLASFCQGTPEWKKICDVADKVINFEVHGEDVYLWTHHRAPHFKIVKTSLKNPDFDRAETIVPESNVIVEDFVAARDALYVKSRDGSISQVIRIPYGGTAEQLKLPFEGAAAYLLSKDDQRVGKSDSRVGGILLSMMSWTRHESIYEYDPIADWAKPTLRERFTELDFQAEGKYNPPNDLVAEEVEVRSHDGTMVPLSIIYKQGIELDGSNPCWLMGYGAYGYSLEPHYKHSNYAWYERGGILAIAHVRGGGENGEEWYQAGFQQTKPNTWKDFIACAEYLIDRQYTSPKKLAGEGRSAGGILIGRSITERPDLFAVAISQVGCLNPIRLETTSNGVNNIPELGSCQTESGFQALYEMDAFLHVKDEIDYPAMMITHGMNDGTCEPWQSTKFAARIQAASVSNKPILLRMDYEAGHGLGSTKTQQIQERADIFIFMMWQFGMQNYQL